MLIEIIAAIFALNKLTSSSKSSSKSSTIPAGSALDYIRQHGEAAKTIEKFYRIPKLVTLAQGGLESGWGTSSIAKNSNNHFGVKEVMQKLVQEVVEFY